MADLVSEIISQQAIDQLEFANSQLELAVKNVNNVASAAKGITIDFKGAANIGELNATLAKQEQALKDLETATKKYQSAVDSKQRAIDIAERNELLAIQKVIAEREKAAKQLELSEKQKQQAAEREEKALAKLNNAYEQLKVQYKQAADEAKRLGAEYGVMDSRAQAAAGGAMKLYNSLLAVEKSVGQAQRQVGQYNTAAVAMGQILREMPAFTYSAATGFLAMSNNIPVLVDEISKLKAANEALKASGGTAIPIWKTLMSAITSPVGLITIATTAITFLAAKTDIFKSSADEAAKSAENLADKLREVGEAANINYSNQITQATTLLNILKDNEIRDKTKLVAFKELQKLYPQYLANLTAEDALKGKANEFLAIIEEEIGIKVELETIEKRRNVLIEARMKLQKEANEVEDDSIFGKNKYEKRTEIEAKISDIDAQIAQSTKQIKDYKSALLSFPQAPEKTKTPKAKKEKEVKDTTLKSESDLAKAKYEREKQQIEQDAQNQKDISDNTKNELNKRLDAYMEYQSALFQLSVLDRDFIVKQEQLKIAELQRKRKDATKSEQENIDDQIEAANLRIKTAEEKSAGDLVAIQKKGAAERLAIIEGSNDKFIEAQKELLIKLSTNEEFLYLNEIEALKEALEKKEITRREYNKRLTELQKKQHIAFLQAEKEFIEKVLANESLTPENRAKYEEKLKNIIAAMAKGEKAPDLKNKKGRPTDRLAKLFVPEDFPEMEEYLDEFYNRTIDLANRAADAIIEAKNRQFDAENARLDEQSRKIEANYLEQSRLIDATVKDENDRYNQQQKLLAQTQAQEATIEQQKREVAKRQAAAQKTAAIAAIIQNTAIAVAGALKYGPAAPPIIALIAAAGAIQLAAAANTPIPAYKEGTDNHKGGKFYAGDGGEKELIVSPNKAPYWSKNVTTMYDEPAGTKVIPKSVIDYAMSNTTANTSSLSAAYEAHSNALFAKVVGDIVGKQFEATGRKLAYVIQDSKPTPPKGESMREELSKLRNLQGL